MNHVTLGYIVDVAGAVVLAALGVWLLWLKPRGRTNLLLAAFALLMGTGYVLRNLGPVDSTDSHPVVQAAAVLVLGATAVLVPLGTRLPRPMARSERRLLVLPAVGIALPLAGTLAFPREASGVALLTSFGLAQSLLLLSFSFVLLLLPLRAYRWADDPDAGPLLRQTVLAAAALTVFPGLYFGAFMQPVLVALPVLAGFLWLRVVFHGSRGDAGPRAGISGARNVALLSLAVPLAGMVLRLWLGDAWIRSGAAGLGRTLTVLVLAYAILRHQLLGIDVKVRWTVSKTTIAAFFIAVFFIVSEGAQVLFAGFADSEILGIVAAGGLLFVLAPLQRLGDRIAENVVPSDAPATTSEAEDTYRRALGVALRDREITRAEERELLVVADRLGIGSERAFELREEVEAESKDVES